MTTSHNRIIEKILQGATILTFSFMFLLQQTAFAQVPVSVQPALSSESEPHALQAKIIASADPLILKVIFVNPVKEDIVLLVKNDRREAVYTRKLENTESYNSRMDVSTLPDGRYTFEVIGAGSRFSETFQIITQSARLTSIQ